MATYNGAEHLLEQLESILAQLDDDDEVVVVDDGSSDDTPNILLATEDVRVRLVLRKVNRGHVTTFEEALALAEHEHVFLADQDDLWPDGRVLAMQKALLCAGVVAGNVAPLDPALPVRPSGALGRWRLDERSASTPGRTIVRLAASQVPYYGCAMAIRRDLLELALPFPPSVRELHDAWLALIGLSCREMIHLEADVVLRRLHGSNASGHPRSLWRIIQGRVLFVRMWVAAYQRTRQRRGATTRRDE